ncbi:MAG: hypothetical protein ACXWWP_09340 [Candidatus Binatia bacterium]
MLSGDAHDFHQLAGHLGGHLIPHAALAVGIGIEKSKNLFLGDPGLSQTVEELTEAYFTA